MARWGLFRCSALVLGGTLAFAGCDAQPAPGDASPTSTATPGPAVVDPDATAIDLEDWGVVVGIPDPGATAVVGDDSLVVSSSGEVAYYRDGSWSTWEVLPRAAGDADSGDGAALQEVLLSDEGPVFGVSVEGQTLAYTLYLWRPGDPQPTVIDEWRDIRYWPDYAVEGDRAYIVVEHDGASCVDRLDLAADRPAGTAETVFCAEGGDYLFDPGIDGGVLVAGQRPPADECLTEARRIDLATGAATTVDVGPCAFSVLAGHDFTAWTVVPDDRSEPGAWDHVPVVVGGADGPRTVGTSAADAPLVCDGALYLTRDDAGSVDLVRWRPGAPRTVVFQSLDLRVGIDATCADGRVGVALHTSERSTVLTAPLLDWSAPAPPD